MDTSRRITIATLVLRIITLLLLAASVSILFTHKAKLSDGSKTTFTDFIAYRYAVACGLIGFAYTLIQIPFSVYHVSTEKRLIRNGCLPEFDFYGDKVIAFLLATGAAGGFAVTIELKRFLRDIFKFIETLGGGEDDTQSKLDKFLDKANISIGLLFLAFLCMAVLSILSSITKATTSSSRDFFR